METHTSSSLQGQWGMCLQAGAGRTQMLKKPLLQQNPSGASHCSYLTVEAMDLWSKKPVFKVCLFQASYQCREQMGRKEKQFKGIK